MVKNIILFLILGVLYMIYISVKNKKILDNIIEIFDNNELKFCYDNDDMYSLIRKSTIVVDRKSVV